VTAFLVLLDKESDRALVHLPLKCYTYLKAVMKPVLKVNLIQVIALK